MSDFLLVFAVAIFGLLAQAAGGKRQRRLVVSPALSSLSNQRVSAQPAQPQGGSTVVDDFAIQSSTIYPTAAAKAELPSTSAGVSVEPEARTEAISVEGAATGAKTEAISVEDAEPEAKTEAISVEGAAPEAKTEAISVEGAEPVAKTEAISVEGAEPEAKTETISVKPVEAVAELPAEKLHRIESDRIESDSKPASQIAEPTPVLKETSAPDVATPPVIDAGASSVSSDSAAPLTSPPLSQGPEVEYYMSRKPGLEYFLRFVIFFWFLGLALYFFITNSGLSQTDLIQPDPWVAQVTFVTCAITGFTLIRSFRSALSFVLSTVECLFDWNMLKSTMKNWSALKPAFQSDKVYVPTSVPHMVGFFIYTQTMFYLLSAMSPKQDFQMPGMPIPMPLPMDQLFSYNGLGLVTLAFCGAGIFVTRNFKEVLQRLALVKPSAQQVGIGLSLIVMSFLYDYVWSLYTHGQHMGLDTKLAGYNGGTFTAQGGLSASIILALATALFAGVGEETLIRGGLQPMLGLVPAAIMHGVLHAQFQHAPIFIVQVAGWSILMGIVKKYTNTTTTIIGHAGFNFVTTFLFSFNPPDL